MENNPSEIWDPVGEDISKLGLEKNLAEIEQKYAYLLKNPNLPKFLRLFVIIVSSTIFGIFLYYKLVRNVDLTNILFSAIIATFSLYLIWIGTVQVELSKKIFAARKLWLYSPKVKYERYKKLIALFRPLIHLSKVTAIKDEFWGKFEDTDIWMAEMWKESEHAENADCIYVFRLHKHVATDLVIIPERRVSISKRFSRGTDLDLESGEFNRLFHITYDNREIGKNQKIYEVLNPAVMADLIDLRYAKGEYGLFIKDNILAICFSNQFQMGLKYTNFFKKVAIDERDIKTFDQKISSLLHLGYKVVNSLS